MGWLADESPALRDFMLAQGRVMRLARGMPLYATGDVPDAMFGLVRGSADLSMAIAADEEVLMHRAGPGFWIGDSALLARTDRALTVTAATDCEFLRVPGAAVRARLAAEPGDWPAFFRLNHINAVMAVRVLAEMLGLPPRARFARTLLRIAQPDGVVPATQADLARMTGMSRASFRRAMAELIDGGALETGYGALAIRDARRLADLAQLDAPPPPPAG